MRKSAPNFAPRYSIWPFILLALGVLSLLILFPSLTLWLPRLLN
ncbi:TPA: hypothetical protein ACWV9B_001188 [Pseudomonas aeruginosa]